MTKIADIDEMMYMCGLDVLHPGGLQKTDEMARMCHISLDKIVLDIGAGRGATACHLARKYGCKVTAIDASDRMIQACRERATSEAVQDRVGFRVADACALPFDSSSFDIVIAECVTTLLDTEKALGEMIRVTKPGGYVGDLEMTWQKEPPKAAVTETYDLWGGYHTMTLTRWRELLERLELQDVQAVDFSEALDDMERTMRRELGLSGMFKLQWRLAWRANLRRAMRDYRRLFKAYTDYIGYGYFVGRKPR